MAELFLKEKKYLPFILEAATEYNVPAALILAHIAQESNFNQTAYRAEPAINDASYGLMQVLLATAIGIDNAATVEKLYDPEFNIHIGTAYISKNLKRYPTNLQDAIAAYNAGTAYKDINGRYVSKSGKDVQVYVDRVTNYLKKYESWLLPATTEQATQKVDISKVATIQFSWIDIVVPLIIAGVAIYWVIQRNKPDEYESD